MTSCAGDTSEVNETLIQTEMKAITVPAVRKRMRIVEKEDAERDAELLLDINLYSTKKNIAQGMLDLSLLSANCSQLKYLLYYRNAIIASETDYDYYFILNLSFIGVSIGLQVVVGILLLLNVRHNIRLTRYQTSADTCSNVTLIGVFVIAVVNIFLGVFISA